VTQQDVISKGLLTKKRKDPFIIIMKRYNEEGIFGNDLYYPIVRITEQKFVVKVWP
jgi:hypothetical protein